MTTLNLLLTTLAVSAPAVFAGAGLLFRRPVAGASTLASMGSLVGASAAAWLLVGEFRGVVLLAEWAPELGVELSWRLETITLALALLIAAIGALVLQYAGSYFGDSAETRKIIALLAVFETSMLGLVLADNLYFLFVFWELTGIVSFFLISADRGTSEAFEAAKRALLVTSAGALPMLVGIIYLASAAGTASLTALADLDLAIQIQSIALVLFLPGIVTKSAQAPLHSWLPGAMAAPTPVSAYLHSATMVKAGIILLLYLFPVLGASPLWTALLVPIGSVTCILGSYRALGESDIKLLMAWSTVSQLGLLTLTIGLGTDLAVRAAVLHLFAHAVFKAGLFLTVGGIDKAAGTRSLFDLGGLRPQTPALFVAAAILAGSMAGIPPLAGFLSKELILKKAMLAELWVHAVAIAGIVLGSIGTVAYSSRFVIEVFLGRSRDSSGRQRKSIDPRLLLAPVVLAALTLAAGPGASWVDRWFLEPVTASVIGRRLADVTPLSLFYGVNAALLLSVAIVSIGYVSDRIARLRMVPRGPESVSGERLFESALDASRRVGERLSKLFSAAHPAVYLGLALVIGLGAAAPVAVGLAWPVSAPWSSAGLTTVVLLAVILGALLTVSSRLARVLLLSAAGFAVAFLFRLLHAPDLMLTQLLVEVLVTIFFALSLRGLPSYRVEPNAGGARWFALTAALVAAASAGALVLALGGVEAPTHVEDFYRVAAPEFAKGLNLVNVILTDFRALDTLMETLVIVLAAFGVAGLLRGTERPALARARPGAAASKHVEAHAMSEKPTGLLPGMSRLILPLTAVFAVHLLIKGHNEPGGGFVAGLGSSIAVILSMAVALRARRAGSARTIALLGALVLLVSLLGSVAFGAPALTHAHGELSLPGATWKWHTALLFDLGVVLAVAGGVAAATRALWPAPGAVERRAGS